MCANSVYRGVNNLAAAFGRDPKFPRGSALVIDPDVEQAKIESVAAQKAITERTLRKRRKPGRSFLAEGGGEIEELKNTLGA